MLNIERIAGRSIINSITEVLLETPHCITLHFPYCLNAVCRHIVQFYVHDLIVVVTAIIMIRQYGIPWHTALSFIASASTCMHII